MLHLQALEKDLQDWTIANSKLSPDKWFESKGATLSAYSEDDKTKEVSGMIRRHFALGDVTMQRPRIELNDSSVLQRAQLEEMSWNTYQPNNGESASQDQIGGWQSNAVRPVVRNKCISIAAHATARLIFPKVFAENQNSEADEDAARVMEDLMEWSGEQSNYTYTALNRVIAAMVYPASIGYTEYAECYRMIKEVQEDGTYVEKLVLDEDLSGFQDTIVPVDQLYIENFYEPDIQKQGWLIWRRVRSYSLLESIYKAKYPNFEYVKPGVQLIYNDANQSFYQVYDTNMRPEMGEEVIYWNRALDLKIIEVNNVMLTPYDNPNPRLDKLYPFDKFGYELINTRCFYYKSLAFKLLSDANIVNTLYPMIIDGTYLTVMPAMVNIGGEAIDNSVIVPGMVTTLSSPDAKLQSVMPPIDLKSGLSTLMEVEKSLDDSAVDPVAQANAQPGGTTAYEISRIEQNANTVLGLFIQMISDHVRQYGRLRKGDILQHLTIADVTNITDDAELVYKNFLLPAKNGNGSKRIKFDASLPDGNIKKKDKLNLSYKVLDEEGGEDSKHLLYKANPIGFRNNKYKIVISPDVLSPRSKDLERAMKLEVYDRAIQNQNTDQNEVTEDFLFGAYDMISDPKKYIKQEQNTSPLGLPMMSQPGQMETQPNQVPGNKSPLMAMTKNNSALPQSFN